MTGDGRQGPERQDAERETWFAPAARAHGAELQSHVDAITQNAVVDTLMKTVSGLLAVLNERRQILAVNDTFLTALGISDTQALLGLRPGEAINCIHARDLPGGCGTSRYCSSCGAAVAIVSCLDNDRPTERKCVATVLKGDATEDRCFVVRSSPLAIQGNRFLLLYLQDITAEEDMASLDQAFFHDMNNILAALTNTCVLLRMRAKDPVRTAQLADQAHRLVTRLAKELEMQNLLVHAEQGDYRPEPQPLGIKIVFDELAHFFANHPKAEDKTLAMPGEIPPLSVVVDFPLLFRILVNMVTNAFEASERGDTVRLWVEREGGVWPSVSGTGSTFPAR